VNTVDIAIQVAAEIEAVLSKVEALGALVAAAHLDSAIESLCREFNLPRTSSVMD
jgi:hypothetical protein